MANYNNLDDFFTALENAFNTLKVEMPNIVKQNVPNLTNTIKLRVSNHGEKADGGKFSTPYSRSHTYKRKKYGNGALGKQTGYKGFYYQGTMWDSFGVVSSSNTGNSVNVRLGFLGNNLYLSNERLNEIHSFNENIAIGAASDTEQMNFVRTIGRSIGDYLKASL